MMGNCSHEFVFGIDSWLGDGVSGVVKCVKCGLTGGFRADLSVVEDALSQFFASGDFRVSRALDNRELVIDIEEEDE